MIALIRAALEEDVGEVGDVSTLWTVPQDAHARAAIIAKQHLVVSGAKAARSVFEMMDAELRLRTLMENGMIAEDGDTVMEIEGPARSILTAERTALNFLGRLSGIATRTRRFVDAVAGTSTRILDTRKTTPGWRVIEKAAVRDGGGVNHRMGLHDMVMVKDNHIVAAGGIERAVSRVRKANVNGLPVEVEVSTLSELEKILPLGVDQVLLVDHDEHFRMRPDHLTAVLDECGSRGRVPVCVVGTAGATVTGSIDPLDSIADICGVRNIWFHVDAAYGGAGLLSQKLRPRFAGIERADSICMDLHKWFYLGFDGSVVLYRNPGDARNVFYTRSDYVQFAKDGPPEEHMFFHFSPELSRRFRGLPAYIALRYFGSELLGRNVEHNHECAAYLARLVRDADDLELINDPDLSICCFRYDPPELAQHPAGVDRLNSQIRTQLQDEGEYYLSPTDVCGRPALRVCICSHTTRAVHMEKLVERVREAGRSLMSSKEVGTIAE